MTEKFIELSLKSNNSLSNKVNKCQSLSESYDDDIQCTKLIDRCCKYMRESEIGLKKKSLFRISANGITLDIVKKRLLSGNPEHLKCIAIGTDDPILNHHSTNDGKHSSTDTPAPGSIFQPSTVIVTDIDTIANILKVCIRYLPEPIIPYDEYNILIEGVKQYGSSSDSDCTALKAIIDSTKNTLSKPHVKVLDYVLSFLYEVTMESETNTMDSENLSRIFSPTFFQIFIDIKAQKDPMIVFAEVNLGAKIIKNMIDDHSNNAKSGLEARLRSVSNSKMLERMQGDIDSGRFRSRSRQHTTVHLEVSDDDSDDDDDDDEEEVEEGGAERA